MRRNQSTPSRDVPHEDDQGAGPTATGVVVGIVGAIIAGYLFITNGDPKGWEPYWFINTGLCLWVPLMVILFVLRQEPAQFGFNRGDARFGLRWVLALWLAMLLPAWLASTWHGFRTAYIGRLSGQMFGVGAVYNILTHQVSWKALLYYELAFGFYMFCWEFFFRGFLLFGFQRTKLGNIGAIILQSIPFVLLHWSLNPAASKPLSEIIGSAIAAPILGWLAIRTRSFLYGFLAHWAVSMTFDLLVLLPFILRAGWVT
jgi:membrane protease YdiL (CAAX protease family)